MLVIICNDRRRIYTKRKVFKNSNKRFLQKKVIKSLFILFVFFTVLILMESDTVYATKQNTIYQRGSGTKSVKKKVSKKTRNKYFSNSAFVGNSISKGLEMYFNSQGKGFLGNPVMLVQGSYSFANDKVANSPYQIKYKGKRYRAKDAIAAAKVKKVFISMGTNDLWKPASQTYKDYVQYIKGIRKKNPKVIIFIQGTTPMRNARSQKYLNNSAINELNKRMKKYCKRNKDMYYIDVSKGLKDSNGELKRKYSSDGYVHLNMNGYKIWTNNLIAYVDKLILQEKEAEDAVKKAAKSGSMEDYNIAVKLVKKLENSTKKDTLNKKLKKIYQMQNTNEE